MFASNERNGRKAMKLMVSIVFAWMACGAPPQHDDVALSHVDPDVEYKEILQLAEDASPESRRQLEHRRTTATTEDARFAATSLIGMWDDSRGGYINDLPIPLRRGCASEGLLEEMRRRIHVTTHVDIELYVDAFGRVTDVRVVRGSGDTEIDRAIETELKHARFLPAKPRDVFVNGVVRMNCRIEAR
jgi:TonB family protein